MVSMGNLISYAHYCNLWWTKCNEQKYFFPYEATSKNEHKFFIFLMGIWLENATLKLIRSILKLFISDSNALKCLLGQQLHMQLDLWNFCQPTCHWQLHAWYKNKTHCSTYHSKQILDNKIHNLTDWSTKVSTKIDIP